MVNRTPVLVVTSPYGSIGHAIQPGQDPFRIACRIASVISPERLPHMTFEVVPDSTVRTAKGTVQP